MDHLASEISYGFKLKRDTRFPYIPAKRNSLPNFSRIQKFSLLHRMQNPKLIYPVYAKPSFSNSPITWLEATKLIVKLAHFHIQRLIRYCW